MQKLYSVKTPEELAKHFRRRSDLAARRADQTTGTNRVALLRETSVFSEVADIIENCEFVGWNLPG